MQDFTSHIKYLRGEAFSDKHWSELCTMLKIPLKSTDQLTFGDFLKAQELVNANIEALQVRSELKFRRDSVLQTLNQYFLNALIIGIEHTSLQRDNH